FRAAPDLRAYPNVVWHPVPKVLNSYFLSQPVLDQAGRWWGRRVARRGGRVGVNGGERSVPPVDRVVPHPRPARRPPPAAPGPPPPPPRLSPRHHCRRETRILPRARLLVTECERNRQELVRLFGVAAGSVRVVYPGVDPALFRPAPEDERRRTRAAMGW